MLDRLDTRAANEGPRSFQDSVLIVDRSINLKALVVGAVNKGKSLVGASVIVKSSFPGLLGNGH